MHLEVERHGTAVQRKPYATENFRYKGKTPADNQILVALAAGLGNMVGVRPNGPNHHAGCNSIDKQRDQYVRAGIKVTPKRLQTNTGTGMAREGNNKKQHPTAPKFPVLLETQAQNATDCKG